MVNSRTVVTAGQQRTTPSALSGVGRRMLCVQPSFRTHRRSPADSREALQLRDL